MIFFLESNDFSVCPICGNDLKYRDSCLRNLKKEGGKSDTYLIRRLKCKHCDKLHRELPDCMVPYKHYSAEVISGVLDEVVTSDDIDSEDYPCEMTICRWQQWLEMNQIWIDSYLKSIGYQMLNFSEELLKSDISLLNKLKSSSEKWLETILRFIYNSGGYLPVI